MQSAAETLVSVIINNYNYERFLSEAIESALNQTYPYLEIIVVDDGSTDNSREIINRYETKIISVFKENGGQASAFNAGFQASKGEIICFLDADDYFFPSKVKRIVELFYQYPDAGWIFHNLEEIDIREKRCLDKFAYVNLKQVILKGELLKYWFPATTGLCFKSDVLKQVLPMPTEFVISSDSFLRLASIYLASGILSPTKLAIHRNHGDNLYAFKKNIGLERSQLYLKVAYHLRNKFPEISKFTNNLWANSLVQVVNYSSFNYAVTLPEYQAYLNYESQFIGRFKLITTVILTYTKIKGRDIVNRQLQKMKI